jgi:hypothetical protein
MANTTDVAQPTDDPGTEQPTSPRHQSSRLNHALAWVGIVAGGLFIVAAIFFSGFFLCWSEMGMRWATIQWRWDTWRWATTQWIAVAI